MTKHTLTSSLDRKSHNNISIVKNILPMGIRWCNLTYWKSHQFRHLYYIYCRICFSCLKYTVESIRNKWIPKWSNDMNSIFLEIYPCHCCYLVSFNNGYYGSPVFCYQWSSRLLLWIWDKYTGFSKARKTMMLLKLWNAFRICGLLIIYCC